MAKSCREDAYNLGLLYVYMYSNGTQKMVSQQSLDSFYEQIENNLEIMDNKTIGTGSNINDEVIYFKSFDEKGKIYYILKPTFNLEKAKSTYIGCVPIEYLIFLQIRCLEYRRGWSHDYRDKFLHLGFFYETCFLKGGVLLRKLWRQSHQAGPF